MIFVALMFVFSSQPSYASFGAQEAKLHEYPSVVYFDGCSGNLTKKDEIVSALHCIDPILFSDELLISASVQKAMDLIAEDIYARAFSEVKSFKFVSWDFVKANYLLLHAATKAYYSDFYLKEAWKTSFSFGNDFSSSGRKPLFDRKSVSGTNVKKISLHPEFIDLALVILFVEEARHSFLRGEIHETLGNFDVVKFHLASPVEGVEPVPALSAKDLRFLTGQISFTVVGFGKSDDGSIDNKWLQELFEDYVEEVDNIVLEVEKTGQIKDSKKRIDQMEEKFLEDVEARAIIELKKLEDSNFGAGIKRSFNIDNGMEDLAFRWDDQYFKSRWVYCSASAGILGGDSGGPAFVRLSNGKLKQFAVARSTGREEQDSRCSYFTEVF